MHCAGDEEYYMINRCSCQILVCERCVGKIAKNEIYKCPYCRHESKYENQLCYWRNSQAKKMATQAKNNWNKWFNILARDYVRQYLPGPMPNHDRYHYVLNTGRFDNPEAAGVCVDDAAARRYVEHQLELFKRRLRSGDDITPRYRPG